MAPRYNIINASLEGKDFYDSKTGVIFSIVLVGKKDTVVEVGSNGEYNITTVDNGDLEIWILSGRLVQYFAASSSN